LQVPGTSPGLCIAPDPGLTRFSTLRYSPAATPGPERPARPRPRTAGNVAVPVDAYRAAAGPGGRVQGRTRLLPVGPRPAARAVLPHPRLPRVLRPHPARLLVDPAAVAARPGLGAGRGQHHRAVRDQLLHVRGDQLRGGRVPAEDPRRAQPAAVPVLHPVLPAPGQRADRAGRRLPEAVPPAEAVELGAGATRGAALAD